MLTHSINVIERNRTPSWANSSASSRDLLSKVDLLLKLLRPTPLVELDVLGLDLRAKLEYSNTVGSLKDRSAIWALKGAIGRGEIGPDTTIVESSSGNFANALAFYCHFLGLTFIPVIDPNIAPLNEVYLKAMRRDHQASLPRSPRPAQRQSP